MRQRRRAERGRYSLPSGSQRPASRHEIEARQRRTLWIGAGVVLLVVVAILAVGWYLSYFQPPRKTVATLDGQAIRLRDVIPYSILNAVETDGTIRPDAALNAMIRDRVVEQHAGELGVTVTDADVDQLIVNRFEPVPPGSTAPADQLTEAGRDAFDRYLKAVDVKEDQFRVWLTGQAYQVGLQDYFIATQPEDAVQVYVQWIVAETSVTAQNAMARIADGESFATVSVDLNTEHTLADASGVVGWMPKGAIPELDSVLFAPDLELDTLIGPLSTSLGTMIIEVTDGPSTQPLSDVMKSLLATQARSQWVNGLVADADLDYKGLTTEDSQWVADHINK